MAVMLTAEAVVTVNTTSEGWATIVDVDPPDAQVALVSIELLRGMVDELNEALNLRTERDVAQREAAELAEAGL